MGSPGYSKALGRQGQKEVRELLLRYAPHLGERDITSRPMGSPGEDLILSEAAFQTYPFDIEVKFAKKLNLVAAVQQACAEGRQDGTPIAFGCYRLDKPKKWYVCLEAEDFLNILLGEKNDRQ